MQVELEVDPKGDLIYYNNTDASTKKVVKSGTFDGLIRALTQPYADPEDVKSFLLTYRSFATPLTLFEKMKQRYINTSIEANDIEASDDKKHDPVPLRIVNFLKNWVDKYFEFDFQGNKELIDAMFKFVNELQNSMALPANQIQRALEKRLSKEEYTELGALSFSSQTPEPIRPYTLNFKDLTVLDIAPLEMARQLTIIEYSMFRKIQPKECLQQAWTGGERQIRAPNIYAIITRFNRVSNWVSSEIVSEGKLKQRVALLRYFIKLARKCLKLNNFNAVMEITSGLLNNSVFRLKKTWEQLQNKTKKKFDAMTKLMSNETNYRSYRDGLRSSNPPVVPYFGMYLTDLIYIENGNPDKTKENHINFDKSRIIARVIKEIQSYQQAPYNLEQIPEFEAYFNNLKCLPETDIHQYSILCEPKEVKDKPNFAQIAARRISQL